MISLLCTGLFLAGFLFAVWTIISTVYAHLDRIREVLGDLPPVTPARAEPVVIQLRPAPMPVRVPLRAAA